MIRITATAVLICGLLSACGSGSEATDESSTAADPSAGEHLLSDQQRLLENAQSTADAMEKATQDRQQALDGAEQ